jgi:hypothetical protein
MLRLKGPRVSLENQVPRIHRSEGLFTRTLIFMLRRVARCRATKLEPILYVRRMASLDTVRQDFVVCVNRP